MLKEDFQEEIKENYNFNDTKTNVIDIETSWKKEKIISVSSTQTEDLSFKESQFQTITTCNQQVQTVPEKLKSQNFLQDYNRETMLKFLSLVEPLISSQLMNNIRSSAFDGYTVNWEPEIDEISCVHTLKEKRREIDTICTDLTWNKSGSVLGVAYGRYDHESWCTHKGDVIVWQTNDVDNPILAYSKMEELSHEEPVSKVTWIPGKKHGDFDELMEKFLFGVSKIKWHHLYQGTCMSVTRENTSTFIVGTESGFILKCKTDSMCSFLSTRKKGDVITGNPVTFIFSTKHSGPVQSVVCSPFHRNLFLSCGSDGQLRLYNLLQQNRNSPVTKFQASESQNTSLTAIYFNKKKPELFSTSDSTGEVKIWRLSSLLFNFDNNDLHFIDLLGSEIS
ncbi:WD repeat-containing protein 34 [Lobulomyces angularis]|nr:WD repeat-containing protein 34 [Lobulomyces angularis]